jgi:hypothetical protein
MEQKPGSLRRSRENHFRNSFGTNYLIKGRGRESAVQQWQDDRE